MTKTMTIAAVASGLALSAGAAWAHHSAAQFDPAKTVAIVGTMQSIDWVNPHIHVTVLVPDAKGDQVTWFFEGNPPAWFARAGLKKADFAKGVGSKVTVDANPMRDGRPGGSLIAVKFPDGSQIKVR